MADTKPARQRLHTLQDAAAILQLCTRTVRRMIDRGELKSLQVGRCIRIENDDLELYLLRARK